MSNCPAKVGKRIKKMKNADGKMTRDCVLVRIGYVDPEMSYLVLLFGNRNMDSGIAFTPSHVRNCLKKKQESNIVKLSVEIHRYGGFYHGI